MLGCSQPKGRWRALRPRLELSRALSSQAPDSSASQLRSQVCPQQLARGQCPSSALLCPFHAPRPTIRPPSMGCQQRKWTSLDQWKKEKTTPHGSLGWKPSLPVASYPWWGHLSARACVSAVVPPDGMFGRSQSPIQVAICSEKWVPFQCVLPRTLWPGSHWEGSQEN